MKKYDAQKECLIFLHINKTGGDCLWKSMRRCFEKAADWQTSFFLNYDPLRSDLLERMSSERRRELRFLCGHFSFGDHKRLPIPSSYISLLRNPIDRAISMYYSYQVNPKNPYYKQANSLIFEDFICDSSVFHYFNNDQTRLLAGLSTEENSEAMLDIATVNIEKYFAFCGLFEEFDETCLLLKRVLGWNELFFTRSNTTAIRPKVTEISQRLRDLLEEQNELDFKLYSFVKSLFEKVKASHPDLEADKACFRILNRVRSVSHPQSISQSFSSCFDAYCRADYALASSEVLAILDDYPLPSNESADEKYNIALMLKDLGFNEMSEKWFQSALTICDESTKMRCFFHLGEIAFNNNDYCAAKKLFQDCLKVNPDHKKAAQYCDMINSLKRGS